MRNPIPFRLACAIAALAAAALGACGGGGGGDASASAGATPVAPAAPAGGGTATTLATSVAGTITGFGSVIVDGRKYDDSLTAVMRGNDPNATTAGALTDLKLGMRIEGVVRDGKLTDALISAAANGPIASIDRAAGSFTVYGQVISVSTTGATPTVFEGAANLAALAVGDVVEVHGALDASRVVSATRVERKPRSEATDGVRVGGVIASLDAAAKTFRLNDMTVDYSAAALLPEGVTLANGQVFSAFGNTPPGVAGFRPKTIKVVQAGDGIPFELSGRIMLYTSLSNFSVSGVRADASAATFEGGVSADLATSVVVSLAGTMRNGVLQVTSVRILKTSADVLASLNGQVSEFVSAGSFKLRGTVVDASAATVAFSGGSAADLGNGAWLLVKGKVSGDTLKADSVEFQAPPADKPVTLKGEIRDFDLASGSFHFLGVTLKLGPGVSVSGGTLANLANGRRVEVTGIPGRDGVLVVSSITFLGELAPQPSVLGGRISDVTAGGFTLPGGITVVVSRSTAFEGGTAADLAGGVAVLAKGLVSGATKTMTASWIQIERAEVSGVRVAGAMGDYVSATDFRIGGQRIDASSAVFTDGTAADLANGRVLEVRGTIVNGSAGTKVLKAGAVRFLVK
jgi:hypothetical protein